MTEENSTSSIGGAAAPGHGHRTESLHQSGMLAVRNIGPPVAATLSVAKCRDLDASVLQDAIRCHDLGSAAIDRLLASLAAPGDIDARAIPSNALLLFECLTRDIDATLSAIHHRNHNPTLSQHAFNVAILAMAIGIDLGYDEQNVRTIGIAAQVHDLGMARIPERIRMAGRRLTPAEILDIQRHPVHTVNLLGRTTGLPSLVHLVAYQVHERPDGSGYPRGLERKCIHPFARIVHVADAYLAMTSNRPYRPPVMPYAAMVCLLRQAEKNLVEAEVVRSLLRVLSLFPIGSHAVLSDGSVARVVRANHEDFMRPLVAIVQDATGRTVERDERPTLVDLATSPQSVVQAHPSPGSDEVPLSPKIALWRVRAARIFGDAASPGAPEPNVLHAACPS